MIVKYQDTRINLDNIVEWIPDTEILKFFTSDNLNTSSQINMGTPEMAQRAMAMIDRHIARGRSLCNLELLGQYDEKGWIVFVTEGIKRTINRIGGRLGF